MRLLRLARAAAWWTGALLATWLLGLIFACCALLAALGWLFERCTDFMEVTR